MNTTTHPQISHDDRLWKAPARPIEVEPWLFVVAVVVIVLAVGSWHQQSNDVPSSPGDQTNLAQAPARS